MFVYLPIFIMLQLQRHKGVILLVGNQSGYNSILSPLHTAFLHKIKPFPNEMGIKFDKESLVVTQNNYANKIVKTLNVKHSS